MQSSVDYGHATTPHKSSKLPIANSVASRCTMLNRELQHSGALRYTARTSVAAGYLMSVGR